MGFFGKKKGEVPYHPPRSPAVQGPLSFETVSQIFADCADFAQRQIHCAEQQQPLQLCWIDGMIRAERLNDYVIRPLVTGPVPRGLDETKAFLEGGIWNLSVKLRDSLEDVVSDLITGSVAIFFQQGVLTCSVATEEKRAVGAPEDEVSTKGSKDAFVENLRTNTSLTRRHLRSQNLKLQEFSVGRESNTPLDLIWIDGLTNPDLIQRIRNQIQQVDIDGLLTTGDFEELVTQRKAAFFPQMLFTERPDLFCRGLLDGRVGVLIEGIPLGGLMPGNISQFLEAPQDRSYHWCIASALLALRYLCMLVTLLVPGFYIAVTSFHFEMIPTKLAFTIIASKQDVPFSSPFEVMILLLAFEILQEAGLRLPKTIGQTVSIIGGLVVGQAAVEAKILSPAVVIIVATTGIAGFTMPNQDFSNSLRIWRYLIALGASLAGFYGAVAGAAALVFHLAKMESFGLPYLTPFASGAGQQVEGHVVFRQPIPEVKLRQLSLKPQNIRKQK